MSEQDRSVLSIAAGVTAFALTYLCAAFLEWPLLTYFPTQHAWRVVQHAPPDAIPYYGLVLWAVIAGVDAGIVMNAAAGVARRPFSPTFLALCTGWTLISLVITASYFVFRAVT